MERLLALERLKGLGKKNVVQAARTCTRHHIFRCNKMASGSKPLVLRHRLQVKIPLIQLQTESATRYDGHIYYKSKLVNLAQCMKEKKPLLSHNEVAPSNYPFGQCAEGRPTRHLKCEKNFRNEV